MEHLNVNELYSLAIELSLPELLKFCESSNKINKAICLRDEIWRYRLDKDFSNWEYETYEKENLSIKDKYIFLYQLSKLSILKEKLNLITTPYDLYNTKNLYIRKKIEFIPREIGYLANIETLSIIAIGITSLPHEICKLTTLRILNVSFNQLSMLPEKMAQLTKLEELYINNNNFEKFPEVITKLLSLKVLDIGNNKLTSLPETIINLVNLKSLTLDDNPLKIIPNDLTKMPSLKYLSITRDIYPFLEIHYNPGMTTAIK